MIKNISLGEFRDDFHKADRGNQFSYKGLEALYNYLEMMEEDLGQAIELDVIGLCCEYTEFEDIEEYNKTYEPVDSIEDIENYTTVIKIDDDSFIIADY